MPFAVGSMKCPSTGGYSARLIIIIVGAILRHLFLDNFPLSWYLDCSEWELPAKSIHRLRAGRMSMAVSAFWFLLHHEISPRLEHYVCIYGASSVMKPSISQKATGYGSSGLSGKKVGTRASGRVMCNKFRALELTCVSCQIDVKSTRWAV